MTHELFHSIQFAYNYSSNWHTEAFANWAKVTVTGANSLDGNTVRDFLDTPHLSLTDQTNSRHYGAVLYPLYLAQNYGGYAVIRKTYEYFAEGNNFPVSVGKAIADMGHTGSYNTVYADCAGYNYSPSKKYAIYGSSWPTAPDYTDISSPIFSYAADSSLPVTSCQYYRYTASQHENNAVAFTIDITSGSYTDFAAKVAFTTRDTNKSYINDVNVTSSRCTYTLTGVGSTYLDICIIPINKQASSISYSLSMTMTVIPTSGAIYNIVNSLSGKYLNVHYGIDANATNVYQWINDGSTEQKFKLDYESSTASYRIRAMCSSNGTNRVLDIVKSGGIVTSGGNVQIYTAVDPTAQEWLFVNVGKNLFKIVPRSNTSVALTVYGSSNGTGAGTSASSAGNVYVSTYQGSTNQLWSLKAVG